MQSNLPFFLLYLGQYVIDSVRKLVIVFKLPVPVMSYIERASEKKKRTMIESTREWTEVSTKVSTMDDPQY